MRTKISTWTNRKLGLLLGASVIALAAPAFAQSESKTFDVPAQAATSGIPEFAREADIQVLVSADAVKGKHVNAVHGSLSVRAALAQLLAGTGITVVSDDGKTIVLGIEKKSAAAEHPPAHGETVETVVVTGTNIPGQAPAGAEIVTIDRTAIDRSGYSNATDLMRSLPQNFGGGVRSDSTATVDASSRTGQTNSTGGNAVDLRGLGAGTTLILVNGRRLAPTGTAGAYTDISSIPLTAVERIEILPDGASALYGSDAVGGVVNFVLRKDYDGAETGLRFGGVTHGSQKEEQVSQTFGLNWDTGSALFSGEFFNRDALPQNQRRQGASDNTPYGGDNFDWNFCDPGTIIAGGHTYAIPHGQNGTALTPGSFTANTANLCNKNDGAYLYPAETRWNLYGSARQQIGSDITLFADVSYGQRQVINEAPNFAQLTVPDTNAFYVNPTGGAGPITVLYNYDNNVGPFHIDEHVRTFTATVGVTYTPFGDWSITAYTGPAREDQKQHQWLAPDFIALASALASSNPATAFNPFGDGSGTNQAVLDMLHHSSESFFGAHSQLWLSNVTASGSLFELPAGAVKLALGADFRHETFSSTILQRTTISNITLADISTDYHRDVAAGFGELYVPLVGPDNAMPFVQRLDVSLAGRYESYSDFGGSFVPRVGVTWSPVNDLKLRGTWSKSFKAPNLDDLSEANNLSFIYPWPDSSAPGGRSVILLLQGGNASLRPEEAKSWTIGADYAPSQIEGLDLGLTYFNIDYSNRISLLPSQNYLTDPADAAAVNRTPTPAERAAACAIGTFYGNLSSNPGTCTTASIVAIVDSRLRNLASTSENGFDIHASYALPTSMGGFNFGFDATYLTTYDNTVTPTSGTFALVNTANHPLAFKMRDSIGWANDGWAVTAFINYTNSYKDNTSATPRTIESWTTLDLNIAYQFEEDAFWQSKGVLISFSAQNLFDTDPPFYNNPLAVGYDPANASLQGRFISLSLKKSW